MISYAQDSIIELATIVFNADELKRFVADKFEPIELSYTEKFEMQHPMLGYNFNRMPKYDGVQFTIFGKEVLNLMIYENEGMFCSLLLLAAKVPSDFNPFLNNIGFPQNMLPDDYTNGDYHFLAWKKSGFEIFINKVHAGKGSTHQFVASIFNMDLVEIYDMSGLGDLTS